MNKTFVISFGLLALLSFCLNPYLYAASAEETGTDVAVDKNCTNITDQAECCNTTSRCAYVQCNVTESGNTTLLTKCVLNTEITKVCPHIPDPDDRNQCTIKPVEVCRTLMDRDACCAEESCHYINCTNKTDNPVCVSNETFCPGTNGTMDKNGTDDQCLNTTTPAPIVTTGVPTTTNKTNTTTLKPVTTTSTTTLKPTTTSPTPVPHTGQHFDAASFIGGIILTLGLFAIIFFARKFYVARKDKSYRTL